MGLIGQGQYEFNAFGQFRGALNTPQGPIQAQGTWQVIGQQLGMQGMYAYTMLPYNMLPYALVVQVTQSQAGWFAGITSAGEQVTLQKIG